MCVWSEQRKLHHVDHWDLNVPYSSPDLLNHLLKMSIKQKYLAQCLRPTVKTLGYPLAETVALFGSGQKQDGLRGRSPSLAGGVVTNQVSL